MSVKQLTDSSRPDLARGDACVLLPMRAAGADERACLQSLLDHTPADVPIVAVLADAGANEQLSAWQASATPAQKGDAVRAALWVAGPSAGAGAGAESDALTAAVNEAIASLTPADLVLIEAPCLVAAGWLARLRDAAHADTNTASASALADVGTALALYPRGRPAAGLAQLGEQLAAHTMRLRPRLARAVGPCVYLRRDALELVGPLDETLQLSLALELELAQRCLLMGLAHVAADDVLVQTLTDTPPAGRELAPALRERYPFLSQPPRTAASSVLPRALHAARRPRSALDVTIDARALEAATTGTQRHILELIKAVAATGAVRVRLLTAPATDAATIEALRALPHTELLPIDAIQDTTPPSTIFHRPQQVFATADLRLALRLGERIVVNQLDLIAYRNPGYHRDAAHWHSHRRVTRQALAAAERVVVFSEHTRRDLLSDELVDDQRVRTVPPGLDHLDQRRERRPARLGADGDGPRAGDRGAPDDDGFLLCLGTDFRHKNRQFALRLLASLRERHDWHGKLVFAGTHVPHGSSEALEHELLRGRPWLREAVTELGAVDEEEKNWLMSRTAAVVYPSVYEGFGLVPFEAALAGVPCVFASQSSLADVLPPEMAAVVPWDPHASATRVLALLRDGDARERHVRTVAEAARRLTWEDAAEAMVEVYEEAVLAPLTQAQALSRDEVDRERELREVLAARDALVDRLQAEREHAKRMYDELNAEVGSGLSLIGPHGSLPDDVQRSLLALSAHPAVSRPLFGAWALAFRAARALARAVRALLRRGRRS